MFGLPIVLAAFALMGAPASLPVSCNPDTTAAHAALGLTWFTPGTTTPTRIELAPVVCAGLVYLSASPAERLSLRRLNPYYNFTQAEGVGLLVLLHESHHGSGDRDETSTECAAMAHVAAFAALYVPAGELPLVLAYSHAYDASLPADYHERAC